MALALYKRTRLVGRFLWSKIRPVLAAAVRLIPSFSALVSLASLAHNLWTHDVVFSIFMAGISAVNVWGALQQRRKPAPNMTVHMGANVSPDAIVEFDTKLRAIGQRVYDNPSSEVVGEAIQDLRKIVRDLA